jgi:GT2 family glycosyltransferase
MFASDSGYPAVCIVLVNWNDYKNTSACLDSLSEVSYPNYNVIVVDNGSCDGSGEEISKEYEWCDVVFNEDNDGFAIGTNTGIRQALNYDETDYILILNNDIYVEPNFLEPLVDAANTNDSVAIVTGIIRFMESGEIQSAGRSFNRKQVKSPHWHEIRETTPYQTDCVSGALALFSREFLEECGLLDESYFFAMEDIEISWRARCKRWQILVVPDSVVYHKGGMTSKDTPFTWYHRIYGRLKFAKDYHDMTAIVVFAIYMVARIGLNTAKWLLNGRTDLVWSMYSAIIDFLFGKEPHNYTPTE